MENSWLDPTPKPKADNSWLKPSSKTATGYDSIPAIGGVQMSESQKDFDFTLKFGQDNRLLRAQDQSWMEQGALMVGNAAANIVTGLVEGFGYLPEFAEKNSDYSNALTEQMKAWKNPFGEIYRENPNEVFDLSDPGWWFSNVQQLTESAGSFALMGIGLAKVFGGLAKGAATLLRAGKMGNQVASGAANLVSSATLAGVEGAMSGYQVYESTYAENLKRAQMQGMDMTEARMSAARAAANAAAATVRLNTMMNTVLNFGSLTPLFRNPTNKALTWAQTEGKQKVGETMSQWKTRLKNASKADPEIKRVLANRSGWNSFAMEPLKEGIEEVNTMYAEQVGMRTGTGEDISMAEALTDIGQYFEDVTNEEGALNFVLGAFGGMAQTVLIDNIPTKQVIRYDTDGKELVRTDKQGNVTYDKNGKPQYQTKLVSTRTYNKMGALNFFENIRDAIVTDIDYLTKKQTALVQAQAQGNFAQAEKLRGELFMVTALDSVRKGLTEHWIQFYEEIAATDNSKPLPDEAIQQLQALSSESTQSDPSGQQSPPPIIEDMSETTEAMQKGLAKDMTDNAYKERAQQAVKDLRYLQKLHDTLQKKYVIEDNPATGELADHLYFRHADLYMRQQAIEKEEKRIREIEELEQLGSLSEDISLESYNHQIRKYNEKIHALKGVQAELNNDWTDLEAALQTADADTALDLIEKYRAKGVDENDWVGAAKDLVRILQLKHKQLGLALKDATDILHQSVGYTRWAEQNPDMDLQQYADKIGKNELLALDKQNLENLRTQQQLAQQHLQEVTGGQGLNDMLKKFMERKKKITDRINQRNKEENHTLNTILKNQEMAASLDVRQKEARVNQLTEQLKDLEARIQNATQRKQELELELKNLLDKKGGMFRNFSRVIKLREGIALEKSTIRSAEAQIKVIRQQLEILQVKKTEAKKKAEKVRQTTAQQVQDPAHNINEEAEKQMQQQEAEKAAAINEALAQNDTPQSDHNLEDLVEDSEEEPLQAYAELRDFLPAEALPLLDKLEKEFTGKPLRIQAVHDMFQALETREVLTRGQVNGIYLVMKEYLVYKQNLGTTPPPTVEQNSEEQLDYGFDPEFEEVSEFKETSRSEAPETTIPSNEIPQEQRSEQPELVSNLTYFTDEGLANAYWPSTPRTVNAVKVNSADLLYIPIHYDGKLMKRNRTQDDGPMLDHTSNKDRMVPGRIKVGDELELTIDENFDGQILNDYDITWDEDLTMMQLEDSYSNYLDENGKIRMDERLSERGFGNVPIKITHVKTGKVVGYLPRVGWIRSTKGGANFDNVEDLFPADADGNRAEGNVEHQANINLAIRRTLAEQHNAKPGAAMYTTVTQRTAGQIMRVGELTESTGKVRYKYKTMKEVLPDPALKLGVIVSAENILIGKGQEASRVMTLEINAGDAAAVMPGSPVVFIPLANGNFKPVPILTPNLRDRPADLNTIEKAIEVHLQFMHKRLDDQGKKIIEDIQRHTGFNLEKEDDLRDFIEQYFTFTSGFNDTLTQADAAVLKDAEGNEKPKVQKFMLSIPSKGVGTVSPIKIGTAYSGLASLYARLGKDGKLDPTFAYALRAGLSTRFKNLTFTNGRIRGINEEPREFKSVIIRKDGVVSSKKFDSYNDYAKSFMSSNVYGKHKVGDQYVYTANSQIIMDETPLLSAQDEIRWLEDESMEADPLSGFTPEEQSDQDVNLEDFGFFMQRPTAKPYIANSESPALNLDALQQLYKFTPEHLRNNQSPQQVLMHLRSLGIRTLEDGYNPFLKC